MFSELFRSIRTLFQPPTADELQEVTYWRGKLIAAKSASIIAKSGLREAEARGDTRDQHRFWNELTKAMTARLEAERELEKLT